MPGILTPDYAASAHQPLDRVSRVELAMLATRYAWAAGHAAGKDIAEIACGAGIGAGWLARMARSLVVGDIDPRNCCLARETYARSAIEVRQIDAFDLPFRSSSLDLLVLLEAIYFLRDAESFFDEACRVLRRGGSLLVSTVNPAWRGFRPSPLATRYFTARELTTSLNESGFSTRIQAGFAEPHGIVSRVIEKFSARKENIPRELEPGRNASEKLIATNPEMDLRRYRTLYIQATKAR